MQLVDVNGRIILEDYIDSSKQINIENLPNGFYYIKFQNGEMLELIKKQNVEYH